MSNDLFDVNHSSPVIDPNKDYSADLLGEGKKFKDVAALARGKVESDYFIKSLQDELSGLRQELQKRDQLAEMIDKLNHKVTPQEPQNLQTSIDPPRAPEVNLDEIFEKKFAEREAIKRAQDNVRKVQSALQEQLGTEYVSVLETKARELGVDKTFINDLAAKSPEAVLRLVGVENKAPKGNDLFTPPPRNQQSGFTPSSSVRNKAYYDKIKKENSAHYWSKDTQVQMHKDAMDQGESFYS